MANLQLAQERGLIDIKLFVPEAKSLSEEEILAGMNRIDAAIAEGECEVNEHWPHDVTPEPLME